MIYILSYLLSLADLAATMYEGGVNVEANPLGLLLMQSPAALIVYKVFIVGAALLVLWRFRKERFARVGAWAVFGLNIMLSAYHVACIGAAHWILFI